MSKKTRFAIAALATILALATPTLVLAQGPGGRGGCAGPAANGPRHPLGRVLSQMDLTDEQEAQIQAVLDETRAGRQAEREQLRAARLSLRQAVQAPQPDEQAIRAAAVGVAELEADAAVARARSLTRVREALTPEQVAQFDELLAQAPQRLRGGRGSHGRGPGMRPGTGNDL